MWKPVHKKSNRNSFEKENTKSQLRKTLYNHKPTAKNQNLMANGNKPWRIKQLTKATEHFQKQQDQGTKLQNSKMIQTNKT